MRYQATPGAPLAAARECLDGAMDGSDDVSRRGTEGVKICHTIHVHISSRPLSLVFWLSHAAHG